MEDGDWLAATTAVLLARHPDEARHRLAAALLRSVDGTVAVRFSVVRTRSSLQVEVTPLLGASAPARDTRPMPSTASSPSSTATGARAASSRSR